jgi:chromosomal replication initiator protein
MKHTSLHPTLPPPDELWKAIQGQLQIQLTRSIYETWIKNTVGSKFESQSLIVQVPTSFTAEWLGTRLKPLILQAIKKISPSVTDVTFQVGQYRPVFTKTKPNETGTIPMFKQHLPNPRYDFESFVVGESNRLAYSSARNVVTSKDTTFNPLLICSGPGLGKTHLLQAIAKSCRDMKIDYLYVTAEQFTNDFIEAIKTKTTNAFRERYRNVDVFLIDDIQFIAGKEKTREGFFHTFNELHNGNKKIVIASDTIPNRMGDMDHRLRSRFSWGLVADITSPDFDTRLAILESRVKKQRWTIGYDALTIIADKIEGSIRDLEGALNRVISTARALDLPPDVKLVVKSLESLIPKLSGRSITKEAIFKCVCNALNVSEKDLLGGSRQRELVRARHLSMYLLRNETGMPVTNIGRIMGDRNHSTVLHGIKAVSAGLTHDIALQNDLETIRKNLSSV